MIYFLAMKTLRQFWNERRDPIIGAAIGSLALALYARTLAPSVACIFCDTLELQYVIPRLGILHPTGYPLYALVGKLFTLIVPFNDPAFRLNLFSACAGALAVALVYLSARRLTDYRFGAVIGALTFAVGETFWAQAVAAEVYTLQMLLVALVLYLTLRYAIRTTHYAFYALAFTMGLGLTHHRLIVLLYPAITFYVLLVNRTILRDWKTLSRAALFLLLPFAFYLYLPVRGTVGSADGTYENTLAGFVAWVTAQQYTAFLTQNPLQVQRDAAYYWTLFQNQFGIVGLALATIGVVWLLRRPHEWVLLAVALITQAAFVFNYRVADVEVHFLSTFLIVALLAGLGLDALFALANAKQAANSRQQAVKLLLLAACWLLAALVPLNLLLTNYPTNELSNKWDIHDYGLDVLNQPLEKNATIVGILGEMTLLRYFQETRNIRPDVQTIAADEERARLAAVDTALKQNRVVYLTRPLKGAADKYALTSLGPLIRVQSQPVPTVPSSSHPLDEDFGIAKLIGYDLDITRLNALPGRWHAENGRFLRLTLYWQATDKITDDAIVSIKVLRQDRHIVGQADHRPVRDAYPTTAWRAGEVIADTYDVPVFLGATPGAYAVNVTLYDAQSGMVIGQRDLTQVTLAPDLSAPRREAWNLARDADADFGALALAGYSLDADAPIRPGDALPLTLLWRAGSAKISDSLVTRVWLEDDAGKSVASRDAPLGGGFAAAQWQPNQYVRDWPVIHVPANVADGTYTVKLAVARGNQLAGASFLPFRATVVRLGQVTIKNRARVMNVPVIAHPFESTFDKKIRLLGYDLNVDSTQRKARLTLYWKALALMDTSYTVFVHLLDANNTVVAAGDAVPGNGEFPTTGWIENEYLTDVHAFALPADLPPDTYLIEIGLYDPASGARLKTADGQERVILVTLDVP